MIFILNKFNEFETLLVEKESSVKLSRMIAGYAWPWISKKNKDKKDICIEGKYRMWNHCTEGWVESDEAINEVGCIHSIQGYDLNYAFVIIGQDIIYRDDQIVIDKKNYFDRNGKATATNAELEEYIKNIYYVLMTRGIKGTYLYIVQPELREYLRKYINTFESGTCW